MKTRLMLIRHGETDWTRRKRYCGSNDIPLNSTGKRQAAKLAVSLDTDGIDSIYCSSLSRCMELARVVFKGRGIIFHPGLREMSFGIFEGLDHQSLLKKFPRLYSLWLKKFGSVTPPGGESFDTFERRVHRTMREIIAENRGKNCAVVTHGGVMMVVIAAIVGKENIWKYLPDLASVTLIEIDGGKKKLLSFNDTSHLLRSAGKRKPSGKVPTARRKKC